MKALAKATSFALFVAAAAPFSVLALGALEGCDKFKKGGEADAAAEAAPVATDTATATDSASASASTTVAAPVWKKPVAHDGGAVDAGVVKLADGGMVAPIPTPIPSGAPAPSGLVIPTAIPTTLPSNLPKGLPSTLPSGLKLPPPPPTK